MKRVTSSLVTLMALNGALAAGCATEAAPADDGGDQALSAHADALVGAYRTAGPSSGGPTFDGIVFLPDGHFFADVDKGVRCSTSPCNSKVRLTGIFRVGPVNIHLDPDFDHPRSEFHGAYAYTRSGEKLTVEQRSATALGATLESAPSYCRQTTDCGGQALSPASCPGAAWTCGEATHVCSASCNGDGDGSAIWPSNAESLVFKREGGFMAPAPAGSTCPAPRSELRFDVSTRELTWDRCERRSLPTDGVAYLASKGARVLTAREVERIDGAFTNVRRSTIDVCGADAPVMLIEVKSPTGTKVYRDSFYACRHQGPYVDGLRAVATTLEELAAQ